MRRVLVGLTVNILMPETECYPPIDPVAVFLGRGELLSPLFLPYFCFSPVPVIVQDSKLTLIYSMRGRKKANGEKKGK